MGLLKRLLSIGSKKNKKSSTTPQQVPPPLPSVDEYQRKQEEEEDHELAIGRLLRSSSSRYAVVKEVDYSALPPLPHPINDVLAQRSQSHHRQNNRGYGLHPSPSMASLASSTFSTQSTFSVTVHDRQRHAATEFPNANRDSSTPVKSTKNSPANDNGNHLGLRSDPSVASLLSLYDEHGHLPPNTFSNSPPPGEKKERQQTKRSGSTLRELLGASNSLNSQIDVNALESDISWAERFLGETDSIISSCGPHTHTSTSMTGHSEKNGHIQTPEFHDTSFCSIMDDTSVIDDPAISSMEVELSVASDNSGILDPVGKDNSPYSNMDPSTPQRASQVFSFLARKNTVHEERALPNVSSSPSNASDDNLRSHFSTDGSSESPALDATIKKSNYRVFNESSKTPKEKKILGEATTVEPANEDPSTDPLQRQIKVLMNGPTKVIVTAPTPGTAPTPSRIPIRGPRVVPGKHRSSASRRTPMLTQRMNGPKSISPKHSRSKDTSLRKQRRPPSASSNTSNISSVAEADVMATVCVLDQLSRSKTYHNSPSRDKENLGNLTAKIELPSTPIRSNTTSRTALLRKVVTPSLFQPPLELVPSPTSSSELSPIGKQMMVDARKIRMRAKEVERERKRPVTSRI